MATTVANHLGFLDDRRHLIDTAQKEISMPFESITQWLAQVLAPTGAIGFILYLALKKFIESKFEKGLEETRSENRRKEDEIKQLREFMSSLKRERGSRIHAKKNRGSRTNNKIKK